VAQEWWTVPLAVVVRISVGVRNGWCSPRRASAQLHYIVWESPKRLRVHGFSSWSFGEPCTQEPERFGPRWYHAFLSESFSVNFVVLLSFSLDETISSILEAPKKSNPLRKPNPREGHVLLLYCVRPGTTLYLSSVCLRHHLQVRTSSQILSR